MKAAAAVAVADAGETRGKLRGGPNEKYREIHLKQQRIFYDYY